jgi:hypothetical protein
MMAVMVTMISFAESPAANATDVMNYARRSFNLKDCELGGTLRDYDTGRVQPFKLLVQGSIIKLRFSEPDELIQLDANVLPYIVKTFGSSESTNSNSADSISVRDSALIYADLRMAHMVWPNAKILFEETIKTMKCWKVRLSKEVPTLPYTTVDLWVHTSTGAIVRVEAFDESANLLKRIELKSIFKSESRVIPSEICIESFVKGKKEPRRTYLKVQRPK